MKIIEICQELTKEIPTGQIFMNEPMNKHTTFKVGGSADIFVKVRNVKELISVIKIAKKNNIHMTIIGNGSNILVKDKGIRGIVVKIEFDEIKIENQKCINKENIINATENKNIINEKEEMWNKQNVIVTVGAGVKLAALAQELLGNCISGFEFASGIPGTIGGAVRMNAGAYGTEMKDIIITTKCLDLKRYDMIGERTNIDDIEVIEVVEKANEPEIVELTNEEQNFGYRDSVFSGKRYVILETKLKLTYADKDKIKEKMAEYTKTRKDKQPDLPSAGSTFKRGEDFITAKLIDECGLKGYKIGGAKVSDKHAGFIVNSGDATAQDILDLIEHVKKVVFEKTGKLIKLEIEILGD